MAQEKTLQDLIYDVESTGKLWFASYRDAHKKAKRELARYIASAQTFDQLGNIRALLDALEFFDQDDYSTEISSILLIRNSQVFLLNAADDGFGVSLGKQTLKRLGFPPNHSFSLLAYIRLVSPQLRFDGYPKVQRAIDFIDSRWLLDPILSGQTPNHRLGQNGMTSFQHEMQMLWDAKMEGVYSKPKIKEELERLLIYGADINAQDIGYEGFYPPLSAKGILHEFGFLSTPPRHSGGNTALHTAVKQGADLGSEHEVGTIKWLIANGAHPEILNQSGQMAVELTKVKTVRKYLFEKMSFKRVALEGDLKALERMWEIIPNAAEKLFAECESQDLLSVLVSKFSSLQRKLRSPERNSDSEDDFKKIRAEYEALLKILANINEYLMQYYWELTVAEPIEKATAETIRNITLFRRNSRLTEMFLRVHERWEYEPPVRASDGRIPAEYVVKKDHDVFKKIIKKASLRPAEYFVGQLSILINQAWVMKKYKPNFKSALKRYVELWEPEQLGKGDMNFGNLLSAIEFHSPAEIKALLKLHGHKGYSLLYILRAQKGIDLADYPKILLAAQELDRELYTKVQRVEASKRKKQAKKALKMGLSLNTTVESGISIFRDAAQNPDVNLETFRVLTSYFKFSSTEWAKAFIRAVGAKKYEISDEINKLIYKNDVRNKKFGEAGQNNTMLHVMASEGDLDIVKDLVDRYGFDPNVENAQGLTAAELTKNAKIRESLENRMKLAYAVKKNDLALFQKLLRSASDDDKVAAYELIEQKRRGSEGFLGIKTWWYSQTYFEMRRALGSVPESLVEGDVFELSSASSGTESSATESGGDESGLQASRVFSNPEPVKGLKAVDENIQEVSANSVCKELWQEAWKSLDASMQNRATQENIYRLLRRLNFFQDDVIELVLKSGHPLHGMRNGNLAGVISLYINQKNHPNVHRVYQEIQLASQSSAWEKSPASRKEVVQSMVTRGLHASLGSPRADSDVLRERTIKVRVQRAR